MKMANQKLTMNTPIVEFKLIIDGLEDKYWTVFKANIEGLKASFGEMSYLECRRAFSPYWKAYKASKTVPKIDVKAPKVSSQTPTKSFNRTFELSVVGGSYRNNLKENVRRIRKAFNENMPYKYAINILKQRWTAYKTPKKSPVQHRSWMTLNEKNMLCKHLIPDLADIVMSYTSPHRQYFNACMNDLRLFKGGRPMGKNRDWGLLELIRSRYPKIFIKSLRKPKVVWASRYEHGVNSWILETESWAFEHALWILRQ